MKKPVSSDITVKYLTQFPSQSSLSLARMMFQENPYVFNSVEHARSLIRTHRGAHGSHNRSHIKDKRFFYTLPECTEQKYEPYVLPTSCNNILFMSDIHFPFQDNQAIDVALMDAKDKAVNTIILGGDILDFYDLSTFDKVPGKSKFINEREDMWRFIDYLGDILPTAKIIWVEGNHEYRFRWYMLRRSAEIFGVDDFSMESLFRTRELGIEYIANKRYIQAGKLNIMHGHEFGNSMQSPVNPARGMYLKSKSSTVFGHLHQSSEHSEADLRGEIQTVYSVGCLCYLHPEYRPLNKWNSGYALIEIKKDGFMVKNKKIIQGKIQ
jgi:predicted phosphodiesterase